MINSKTSGIAMKTKELRELVIYFKDHGMSPTVKELAGMVDLKNFSRTCSLKH
jgi:hypothetical protein